MQELKYVFISYVKENQKIVDKLSHEFRSRGIQFWLDRDQIDAGVRWKQAIRRAIRDGAFFIACFSKEYEERGKTYMNEELTLAIDELRQRPTDKAWFIPVKLNDCEIPDREIGGGETLQDVHYVVLYENWDDGIQRLLRSIQPESTELTDKEKLFEPAEVYFTSGNAKYATGEYNESIADYNEALRLKPNFAEAFVKRGDANRELGQYSAALIDLENAIDLNPNLAEAYNSRGLVMDNLGQYEAAITDFDEAIRLDSEFVEAYYYRGNVKINLKQFSAAVTDYDKAICLKRNFTEVYYKRGLASVELKQYPDALADFNTVIQLNPDYGAEVYYQRGYMKIMTGQKGLAKLDLLTAMDLAEQEGDESLKGNIKWSLHYLDQEPPTPPIIGSTGLR